jgi:UDP-N-acetylglucosamine 2-epimerase (non-hydrolysing)
MDGTRRKREVVCVVGTRPEAVKMAPIVAALRRDDAIVVRLVTTGQHRGLLDRALADFGLEADVDLDLMRPDQTLADATGRALIALSDALGRMSPSFVLAQGDTTTVVAAALASYYLRVPFGHVEAGLRTGQPFRPFPEEKNRAVASHLAELHFAPTNQARDNLLREGISPAAIHVTGNTVIDALRLTASRRVEASVAPATEKYLLVTAHRRESQGEPLEQICAAISELVREHPDLSIVFPVHPNPRVRSVVDRALGGLDRVSLVEPQGYVEFVALMKRSYLILTDSGGVQEEAPALGKPVLVLRDETERPEAVAAGSVQLVGTRRESIVSAVEALLEEPERYRRFATVVNPYGDGWAAERIARIVLRRLGLDAEPMPAGIDESWCSAPRSAVAPAASHGV